MKDAEHECVAKVAQDLGITVSKQRVLVVVSTLYSPTTIDASQLNTIKNMGPDDERMSVC